MTIAVTNVGTFGNIAASVSVTVGAGGIPAGALIVGCVQDTTVGAANGTIADTPVNSYAIATFDQPNNSATNGSTQLFYAWNATALSPGDTITYTGTDPTRSKCLSVAYATGVQTSSDPLIAASVNTATGTSQTLSVTSGSPGVAGALFIACVGRNNPTGATFTQDTAHGWSNPPNDVHEGSGSPHSGVNCGSQVNAANSALTFAPGWSTTANQAILIAAFAPGTTSYTLAAAAGSFTLSGQAAALKTGRKVTASAGSFALSGQSAGLKVARNLTASVGSFSLTGRAAALTVARRIAAGAGAFVLTGQAAALREARKVLAGAGAFSLTGMDATITAGSGNKIAAGAGVFLLSGKSAGLLATRALTAAPGSFSLSGKSAGLLASKLLSAGVGVFQLNGQAASLHRGLQLLAARGQFAFTGHDANVVLFRRLSAGSGTFILSGKDADLEYSGAQAILVINPAWLMTSEPRTRTITSAPRRRTITSRK